MDIRIVSQPIPFSAVAEAAAAQFGDMVKAVVDIDRGVMALGGELHADAEAKLLEDGSRQEHLWGINIYPGKSAAERVEFDSMINIRPSQANRSRGVDDPGTREAVLKTVGRLVIP